MSKSNKSNLNAEQKAALAQVEATLAEAKSNPDNYSQKRKTTVLVIVVFVLTIGLLAATILVNSRGGL